MLRKIAEGVWEDPGDPGQTAGPGTAWNSAAMRWVCAHGAGRARRLAAIRSPGVRCAGR